MKAVIKHAAERGIQVREDWAEPVAGPGQVLLEVAAASLCGTDRELYEWTPSAQAFNLPPPVVLGHEGSGTVLAVGAGVESVTPGERVALESHLICGRCYPCRTGSAHTCERTGILGMHIDGVFAERVAVPAGICVPLPESVSLETGALLAMGVGELRVSEQFVTAGPICTTDDAAAVAGCRVLLKGGQVGPPDLFRRFAGLV